MPVRLQGSAFVARDRVPFRFPQAFRRWAIGFGHPVNLRDVKSQRLNAASVAAGGGAPAVNTSTIWSNGRRFSGLALMTVFRTMGAPPNR